jgi:hypothetical protein
MTYFSTLRPAEPFLVQTAARGDYPLKIWPLDGFEFVIPAITYQDYILPDLYFKIFPNVDVGELKLKRWSKN